MPTSAHLNNYQTTTNYYYKFICSSLDIGKTRATSEKYYWFGIQTAIPNQSVSGGDDAGFFL